MVETNDENDPFEEDIVFDQTGLLGTNHSYSRQQQIPGFLPTFLLFIRTVFLCIVFVSLGLCASISLGPIIHLEVAVGLPVTTAFHTFTACSVGMLIGGLLGSTLFEIYNRQFLIFVSLVWMAVSISVLPFTIAVSFWWTLTTLVALGAGMSFIFTGSNVLCLDLWGKQGSASLQSLHFSFAVGAFIAPIVIHPLLLGPYLPQISGFGPSTSNLTIETLGISARNDRMIRSALNNVSASNYESSFYGPTALKLPSGLDLDSLTLPIPAKPNITSNGTDNSNHVELLNSTTVNNNLLVNSMNTSEIAGSNSKPANPKPSLTNTNLRPDQQLLANPMNTNEIAGSNKPANPKPSFTNTNLRPDQQLLANPMNTNETAGSNSKPTNPKPSFTDANLLPDQQNLVKTSKQERLNQSHSLLAAVTPLTKVVTTTFLPEIKNKAMENSTISKTFINASRNSTLDLTGSDKNLNNIAITKIPHSSLEKSTVTNDLKTVNNLEAGSVDTNDNVTTKSEIGNATSFSKMNLPLNDKKYVIDYSTNNESDGYSNVQDDTDDEFPYSTNSKSFSDPQLRNLKDSSVPDVPNNEGSAITVTVSFPDGEISTHHQIQSKPGTYSNVSDSNLYPLQSIVNKFRNYGVTSLHFVYICTGVFILFIAIISICIMCHNPREPRSRQEEGIRANLHRDNIHFFIFLFSIYMFAAEALQGAVLHLLASSQTENGMPVISKNFGGQAIFWGLVCSMRFLCILLSGCLKLKPGKILVFSTLFMVMGSIFLCIGTFNKLDFLWGGIIVVALGLAPVLPTSFLWMAEHMKVTHKMCALMIIVSSFGNTLTHTTLTHVSAKSHLYSYFLVGISVFALGFLTLSFILLIKTQPSKDLSVPIGYHLANQEEEETLELRPNAKNFDNINRRLSDMGEAAQALLID